MLAIRLQRLGRKGYPVYRVIVQEAHRHPSSGRVVSYVGSYNPHTKEAKIEKDLAEKYLKNGAQPTPRVVKLLEEAGIKMPKWVEKAKPIKRAIRNPDKLRKNQPADTEEVVASVEAEKSAEEAEVKE